jgi:AcrR family transcriptional regulator
MNKMPKDTFFNLAKEKQSFILEISIQEFYDKGFDLTSISHIVERAGIAKGSFYQYFDSKDELFKYIITITNDKKMMHLYPVIESFDQLYFYDWFNNMLFATFDFLKAYPILAKISVDFWKHANTQVKERILGEEMGRTQDFLMTFIEKAIKKQELRDDISCLYLTQYIANQLAFFTDYLLDTYSDLTKVSIESLEKLVHEFVAVIEQGTIQKVEV